MMPKKRLVKSWAYSALTLYEKCPASYKAAKIDKIQSSRKSPAMERGIMIHAKGEQYLKGVIPNVPMEFADFKTELQNLRKHKASAERKLAITKSWKPTGFFDRDVWMRFIIDSDLEMESGRLVIDFKTGKIYDSNEDQAQLYATALLYAGNRTIDTEFWYLDIGEIISNCYEEKQKKMYREYWEDRVAPLFADTKFETNPSSFNCRWCVIRDKCEVAE